MSRFLQAVRDVPHLNHELLPEIAQRTLWHRKLKESLAGKPPTNLEELMTRAEKYIRIEETMGPSLPQKRKAREEEQPWPRGRDERRHVPPRGFTNYTPLTAPRSEVLIVAERRGLIERPRKLKENPKRQRSDKYCRFHRDRGHSTDDCYHLKIEIEKLIQRGYLRDFIEETDGEPREGQRRAPQEYRPRPPPRDEGRHDQHPQDNLPTAGVINVIIGGPAGGDSLNAHKAQIRAASRARNARDPVLEADKTTRTEPSITFDDGDLPKPRGPHNDALVISASLANYCVKKILIDSGSSADIIFYEAFRKLGIDNAQLQRVNTPLIGFSGEPVEALGEVSLPISLGSYPARATKMVKFLVVKAPSAYNMILGRPSLNLFQAVVSTYHMKIKFPTPNGLGEVTGDQLAARECYANSLRKIRMRADQPPSMKTSEKTPTRTIRPLTTPASSAPKDLGGAAKKQKVEVRRLESAEELKMVEILPGDSEGVVKLGPQLGTAPRRSFGEILVKKFRRLRMGDD